MRTVVINEFHYNPSFNPVRESFIELYNDTAAVVDLSNWRVRGGVDYFFPPNTFLQPNAFIVVAEDPATIQARYVRTSCSTKSCTTRPATVRMTAMSWSFSN